MRRELSDAPVIQSDQKWSKLVLLGCFLILGSGCVTQQTKPPRSESQLSLIEARKARSDPKLAAGLYLDAADAALRSINGTSDEAGTDARVAYNRACQELTVLLHANPQLWNRTEIIQSGNHVYRLHFASGSRPAGLWGPDYFDLFRTPKQVRERFSGRVRPDGWGGVLIGVHKPPDPRKFFLPRVGVAAPVTAVINTPEQQANGRSVCDVTLALYDPSKLETARIVGMQEPLDADFAAPIAYYPNPKFLGLAAMLRPGSYRERAGLYLLEPYDPDQIPVILIHGLMSIPQMWVPTIRAVQSDPELHGRFQFWVFAYPTGDPIVLSALRLRENLARIYQLYPRTKSVVLVGHSMGGLVARMQAVNTGHVLWDAVFQKDADRLYATLPPDNLAKKTLIFDANPQVKRIVFICVPHRGSYLATNWIGSIGVSLINLPGNLLGNYEGSIVGSLRSSTGLSRLPTGINGLSPRAPVLRALDMLPITAPYDSIIGDRGRGDTPNSSDGVVPYWSSHLEGAQSELIVPGDHGSFALPQSVAELKRILRLELATRDHTSDKAAKAERSRNQIVVVLR